MAALLPGIAAVDIEVQGPRVAGSGGVHVRTPSGMTPLADLSLGYQEDVRVDRQYGLAPFSTPFREVLTLCLKARSC